MEKYIHKFDTQQEFNNSTTNTTYSPESSFEQYKQSVIGKMENVGISLSSNTYTIENKNYTVDEAWDYNIVIDDNNAYASVLFEDSLGISFVHADTTQIGWGTTERQSCVELLKKISDAINFGESVSLSEVIERAYLNPNEINDESDLFNVCSGSTRCNSGGYLLNFGIGDVASILVIMHDDDLRIVEYDDIFWINGGKSFSSILQEETNFWISQLEANTQLLYTKPFVAKLQSDLYYNDFEYRFKLFYDPIKDYIGFYDDLNKQKYVTVNSNESEGIYHENPLLANVLFASANENIVSNSTIFKFNGSNIPLASHFNEGVCCFGITKQNNIVYFQRISYNGEDIRIQTEAEASTIVATYTNGEWTSQNYKKFITIRRCETLA